MSRLLLVLLILAQVAPSNDAAGSRSFNRLLLLESKGETSASVSIGDIDGNGTPDIVMAKGRHWPLNSLIFRNDGKGHFTTENLADRPDRKLIYLNDGKGHFRAAGTFGQPDWSTRYVTVADLNGDGRPDLIVANRGSNRNSTPSFVCLNDGKGAFPSCRPLATQSATLIVAADLDGDGHIDLFVPHRDGGQSLIFWNDGSGVFSGKPSAFGPAHSSVRAAAAADLDGNGKKDLVVGDEEAGLFVYVNKGNRAFAEGVRLGRKSSPYSIGVADMNRDGKPDIVVGNIEAQGSVFFNEGRAGQLRFQETHWNDGKGAVGCAERSLV